MSGNTNKTDEFLDSVCEKVKCKAMHGDIRAELMSHILEIKERLTGEGKPELEAEDIALQEMGDPQEIGLRLDKIHRPKPEWSVIFLAAAIFLIGIITSNDFFYQFDLSHGVKNTIEVTLFALAGAVIFVLIYYFDLKKILNFSLPVYIGATLGFSAFVLFLSTKQSGFNRLITTGFIIEALSLSFVVHFYQSNFKVLLLSTFFLLLSCFAFSYSNAMLWAIILVFVYAVSVFLVLPRAHLKKVTKIIMFSLASLQSIGILIFVLMMYADAANQVAHNNYILSAFTQAKFIGKSATDRWVLISQSGLSAMICDYGYLFAALVFAAILAFLVRIIKSSINIKDAFYKDIALIVSLIFLFELGIGIINEAGVSIAGQSPTLTLYPFLSHDISSYMLNMILLAVFLSCYRRKNITPSAQLAK